MTKLIVTFCNFANAPESDNDFGQYSFAYDCTVFIINQREWMHQTIKQSARILMSFLVLVVVQFCNLIIWLPQACYG